MNNNITKSMRMPVKLTTETLQVILESHDVN